MLQSNNTLKYKCRRMSNAETTTLINITKNFGSVKKHLIGGV